MATWSEWQAVEGFENPAIDFATRYRERGGGVARITINRPTRMNAVNGDVSSGLVEGMRAANDDPTIGVIVITHAGPHFGVGGDLAGGTNPALGMIDSTIKNCRKPVIAAVRGYCIGASNHMAYSCDFTIAGESTVFGQNGPRIGSPAAGYVVANSAHVMGMKRARELWMRCRHLTAQEGLAAGLCNVVVQDRLVDAEVERFCDDILDLVPTCIARAKRSFEAVDMPLQDTASYIKTDASFREALDVREGGRAFFEKRDPNHWSEELVAQRK